MKQITRCILQILLFSIVFAAFIQSCADDPYLDEIMTGKAENDITVQKHQFSRDADVAVNQLKGTSWKYSIAREKDTYLTVITFSDETCTLPTNSDCLCYYYGYYNGQRDIIWGVKYKQGQELLFIDYGGFWNFNNAGNATNASLAMMAYQAGNNEIKGIIDRLNMTSTSIVLSYDYENYLGSYSTSVYNLVKCSTPVLASGLFGSAYGSGSDSSEGDGSSGEAPYIWIEDYTCYTTKIKVVFRFSSDLKVTKGTIKYGMTSSTGSSANASVVGTTVSATVSNLKPNTTYYFKATATNASGTGYSDVVRLMTNPE